MSGWHHQLDGHEFEQAPGVRVGQGGLACCDSWGRRVGLDCVIFTFTLAAQWLRLCLPIQGVQV